MAIHDSTMTCSDITLTQNTAKSSGGGLAAVYSNLTLHGNITLTSNSAYLGGGMLTINCNFSCDGIAIFDSNTAKELGGGIFSGSVHPCLNNGSVLPTMVYSGGVCEGKYQQFKNSVHFVRNRANTGGGVVVFQGNFSFSGNVKFENNSAILTKGWFSYGGGAFVYQSTIGFQENIVFSGNIASEGGGIYGSYTTLFLNGSMSLVKNYAVARGGGLYLTTESVCWMIENSFLSLSHNSAGQFGGAIYVKDDPFHFCIHGEDYQASCFFQPSTWPSTATIQILSNNYAGEAGSGMYGGMLDRCKLQLPARSETSQWIFSSYDFQNDTQSSFISSDPTRVCLCVFNRPQCDATEQHITVFPGGTLHISAVATGQRNGTVPSVITAGFANQMLSVDSLQDVQSANKTCTILEYRILPAKQFNTSMSTEMSLLPDAPCQLNVVIKPLKLRIHLLRCPSGFELSETPYTSCICSTRVQRYTNSCNIDTQTIVRHGKYWIGWDTSSSGAILHPHCPFDYCRTENTSFPMNDTDRQCQHNRAGVLCGGCEHGYSLGFGSSQCLQCSTNYHLSLMLAFTLAGVALVVLVQTCKLTVAVGTVSGLIFYANIVAANQAHYFPRHTSKGAFLKVFIAWINLDLGIETCFYHGMDMYTRTWLQFAFPLYLWILIGIVIVLSHYFSWATKMFGRNPVAVLATLLLLSYTKILRTIITAISFTYLDYPDNSRVPVWLYDGNIGYLKGKHIALFIAALSTLILLFLPYTLVILCGQWIEARSQRKLLRLISDYRVKAFLDAYHGPLNTKYRYWPGLLLVSRAIVQLIPAFNTNGNPNINLLATATCVVGLITLLSYTGAVYTKQSVYLLELSFLVNCLVLATTHGMIGSALSEREQLILTHTSVGIAFATFTGILVYHILTQVRNSVAWKDLNLQCSWRRQPLQTLVELYNPAERPADTCHNTVTTTSVDLRELVLEDERNS